MKLEKPHKRGNEVIDTIFSPPFAEEVKACLAKMIAQYPCASKGLKAHNYGFIYPVIAAVQLKMESGLSKADAIAEICELYRANFVLPNRKRMRRAMALPGAYKLFVPLARLAMKKVYNEDAGFTNEVLVARKERFAYNVRKCPYCDTCRKFDLAEMVDIFFCTTDDMMYGDLHKKIVFERSQTLGRGGEICDFCFYVDNSRNNLPGRGYK